eukprot:gnl/TRDRNA2_/TRDRNA2_80798_c0_seq1.p1 gnl/TRDRNA2_/TRDRNA2_80798_c0~~gnl/TRDRNA2_/TRDRNA2_80798_c0_seq1.p1  ORF type:complete len:349 (-),score=78.39 gnl/TRDRNA2_/TRDRNA2_80798_c0_seq1:147-1193(-)
MLFPLDKNFTSTGIFQKSGNHSISHKSRVWSIDHRGSHARTLELHALLTEKKPFQAHLDMCQRRADEGRERDSLAAREHASKMKAMQDRMAQQADMERQAMQRGIRDFNMRRAQSDSNLKESMNQMRKDYTNWQKEMSARVGDLPVIWGGDPIRETQERTMARSGRQDELKQMSKDHFTGIKELKKKLDNRGVTDMTPPAKPSGQDDYIEAKKAEGLATLSKNFKDYESKLEALYNGHTERALEERMKRKAEHAELNRKAMERSMSLTTGLGDSHKQRSLELKQMKDRVAAKPKSFGGYQQKIKSDKRLRDELAEAGESSSFPNTMTTNVSEQRTLSPRTLGLATAAE